MFGQDGWPVALTARSPVPLCTQTGSARRHQHTPVSRGDRVHLIRYGADARKVPNAGHDAG